MDKKKIGNSIKNARIRNNLTQDELADKLYVTRQTVSKWETGINLPDFTMLKKTSEILKIPLESLLKSEESIDNKTTKEFFEDKIHMKENNLTYKKAIKNVRWKNTILTVILILILFLGYYFINTFKKIHLYRVTGETEKFLVSNGFFLNTREKIYFNLGSIKSKLEKQPDRIKLYYIKNNDEQLILDADASKIFIKEDYGYGEYFPINDIEIILNNLYVKIYTDKKEIDSFKLTITEEYVNENLFFKGTKSIGLEDGPSVKIDNPIKDNLMTKIKGKFKYRNNKNIKEVEEPIFRIKENNTEKIFSYIETGNYLYLEIFKNNKFIEYYMYQIDTESIDYFVEKDKSSWNYFNGNFTCLSDDCYFSKEKIDYFYECLEPILK